MYLIPTYLKVDDDHNSNFQFKIVIKVGSNQKWPIPTPRSKYKSIKNQIISEGKGQKKKMLPSADPVGVNAGTEELPAVCLAAC